MPQPEVDPGMPAALGPARMQTRQGTNRVGQPEIDGDEAATQNRANLSDGLVSVLPLRINDTARFSVLSLVNHGDQVQSFLVEAHDQNGLSEQRWFCLRAGERWESIVARLFPRFNDYSLRLLQAGDAISMALETWPVFAGNAKIQAVAGAEISHAQRLTFALGDEEALLSFGVIFALGHPAETSSVDVTLWHGDVPMGSAQLMLEDDRRVEIEFAELFPGVEIQGSYFMIAKSREWHRLSVSVRNRDRIVTGLPDAAVDSHVVFLGKKTTKVYSPVAPK